MPYDTDNRSGITKNASESQNKELDEFLVLFIYATSRAAKTKEIHQLFSAHLQILGG